MFIIILLPVLFLAGAALYYFWVPWLAEHDVLFTKVTEGTAKAVMVNGKFKKMVMSFRGYHFNEDTWDIEPDTTLAIHPRLVKKLGVHWMGIIASIYHYRFRWAEFKRDETPEDGGHPVVDPRNEDSDIVMVKDFTYAFVADDLKTSDNLPVRVKYSVTVYAINPYKMLFGTSDWLQRIQLAANRIARNVVGSKNYDALRSEKDGGHELAKEVRHLTVEMPDDDESGTKLPGTGLQYGVGIRTADLQDVELMGANASKFEEATARHYTATKEAEATVIEAGAKAKATKAIGIAEAEVMERKGEAEANSLAKRITTIDASSETGRLLAQLDAMSTPAEGDKIIWANNPLIKS